ncbi:MAG: XTP/dITP diphosphatase [Candidatus Edwardsbacteria bacterium]|nr:XTP/dITP diphosphatase [Candidatus Edwardsbacteria bacterium]
MRIVIATRNRDKLREISQIMECPFLDLSCLSDFPDVPEIEETGETFEDNALLKARSAAQHTGCWALSDDSGLVILSLGGQPGIRSARFAGENATDAYNVEKVLRMLCDTPDDQRRAEFVCCIALVGANNRAYLTEGRLNGTITREPRGTNGFGYDPIFYLPGQNMTMAELSPEVKNAISHRTVALRKMILLLRSIAEQTKIVC